MNILITGAAGFIGMHTCIRLLNEGFRVVGIDNINDYYNIELKKKRVNEIKTLKKNFHFLKLDILNVIKLNELFRRENFDVVINLAAQAGVRFSLTNPKTYIDSNIYGFLNILECCKEFKIKHLIFASSSSVYGLNNNESYDELNDTDKPISIYAATKKSNELMAHAYSNLFQIPATGLRFFTVYGPWVRPDMALSIFTKAILNKKPINLYNYGNMIRDFTYIDDIVEALFRLLKHPPLNLLITDNKDSSNSINTPYRILNIGNGKPVFLNEYVNAIEKTLGIEAIKLFKPLQKGEVLSTSANTENLFNLTGFKPQVSFKEGVNKFIKWYLDTDMEKYY